MPTEDITEEANTPNSMEKDINTTKFDSEDTLEKESNKDEEETDRLQDTSHPRCFYFLSNDGILRPK